MFDTIRTAKPKQGTKLRLKILNEFIAGSPDIRLHTDMPDKDFSSLIERSISVNNLCKGDIDPSYFDLKEFPEPLSFAVIAPSDGTLLGVALLDHSAGSIYISALCGSKFKGVGTLLLDTIKRYATFTGLTFSLASLPSAIGFYKQYGLNANPRIMGEFKWRPPPELARARRNSNAALVKNTNGE